MKMYLLSTCFFLGGILASCDENKDSTTGLTQALCENQTTRADCEAAGCTYTCGMVLTQFQTGETRTCLKRRKVGRCLAVVKFFRENDENNQDYNFTITPNTIGWFGEEVFLQDGIRYLEFFNVKNTNDFTVEVLGHQSWAHDFGLIADPCSHDDPDETLFPWEGSCETDWWSEAMWDDILAK
jgi:hypothetical protein